MGMDYNPQNGDVKTSGPTLYPYEYENHKVTITAVNYKTEDNLTPQGAGARVFCFIDLSNGVRVTGLHEQYDKKDLEAFKQLAYKQAIERAESFGYQLY